MAGFVVAPSPPVYQDTGQGASGRIASWMAWTADPDPLAGPGQTLIWREDNNGALQDGVTPTPLGEGGVGAWGPILDGSSNGATSGGDNCFFLQPPIGNFLTDDFGTPFIFDGTGQSILGNI